MTETARRGFCATVAVRCCYGLLVLLGCHMTRVGCLLHDAVLVVGVRRVLIRFGIWVGGVDNGLMNVACAITV